ncbi:MAG: transglycosylase SLT domain-containing protein [Myxococcota bacterium]
MIQASITRGAAALLLASLCGSLSCQAPAPPRHPVIGILPSVDSAPPAALGWMGIPGTRPTQLSDEERTRRAPVTPPAPPSAARIERLLASRAPRLNEEEQRAVRDELLRAERDHGLDALLLLAMMEQESRFDPDARGPRGSLGLMQIRPFVAKDVARRRGIPWRGPATLRDPALNVRLGVHYFAELKQMYPEDTLALAAYNMGPFRLKRILRSGRVPSSRYVFHVLERYHSLRRGN